MRGRKPSALTIPPHDRTILEQIAHSESLPWFQVRRARTVLSIADGQRTGVVAFQMQCDVETIRRTCQRYRQRGLDGLLELPQRPGRPARISPPPAPQIVELACLEPIAVGLHITHWTSKDLAREAVERGIVPAISDRTIRTILDQVDLQPHRTRYWRTSRIDSRFKQRAEKILWCYANAPRLARQGIWVVCADEKPNFQVLERHPRRPAIPGSIEQREYDYTRHGTVNILVFLIVHSGRMEAVCFDTKSAEHYVRELKAFRGRHRQVRGVYLIHDNDPTHTAAKTSEYLAGCSGWWRSRFTPVHASWLDEAELLIGAFGYHYLKRGSWRSPAEFIAYVAQAWPEYNRLYAHPFEWKWSNQQMRRWVAEHGL